MRAWPVFMSTGRGAGLEREEALEPPRTPAEGERRCALCGISLEGKRSDARYCSSACRVEAWRLRRLLEGRPVGRYATAADRMAAYGRPRRGRRSQGAREGVEPRRPEPARVYSPLDSQTGPARGLVAGATATGGTR